jgi:outer membrane murein-binding lipoprotein Lpp
MSRLLHPLRAGRALGLAAVLLCTVALPGCEETRQIDRLLAAGMTTATQLAAYYDALASAEVDAWRLQTLFNSLNGISVDPTTAPTVNERIAAEHRRGDFARALEQQFSALAQLRDPAGAKSAAEAGQGLGTAIHALPKLGTSLPSAAADLGAAAGDLLRLQRRRDLDRGLKAISKLTGATASFLNDEKPVYANLVANRIAMGSHLVEMLVKRKQATPGVLLPTKIDGIPVAIPAGDPGTSAGLALAGVQATRAGLDWACAGDELQLALTSLQAAESQMRAGAAPAIDDAQGHTARAQSCLASFVALTKVEP